MPFTCGCGEIVEYAGEPTSLCPKCYCGWTKTNFDYQVM
jgi:hypothetical protein